MAGLAALIAVLLLVFCGATLSGLLSAIAVGHWLAIEAFGLLTVGYAVVAGLTLIAVSGVRSRLNREMVFLSAVVLWVALILAAVPAFVVLENRHPLVALFEAASAAVTLGISLTPVAEMSAPMIVYRTVVAWMGGFLTILLAIYVLGRYGVGGTPNRDLRFVLHGFSRGDPRIRYTANEVLLPYLGLTVICAIGLMLARVEPGRALLLAMNVLATNGFTGRATGGSILNNQAAETVMLVFMIVGATSIILIRALMGRRLRQVQEGQEFWAYAITLAIIVALAIAAPLIGTGNSDRILPGLFSRVFDSVSVLTTTGLTHTPSRGPQMPVELLIGLALFGGCAYSTAGGMKIFRLRAMIQHSANEVKRLVFPNQLLPHSIDTDDSMFVSAKAIWSAFFAGLIFLVGLMMLFALNGHGFAGSMSMAVGAFSATGNLVEPNLITESGEGIPLSSLMLVSLAGIAGRVEVLVILAAFGRSRWG